MILRSIDEHEGLEILEDLRYYIIWKYINRYDDMMVNALAILSQSNLITEKLYFNKKCAFNLLYHDLRKHFLTWLNEKKSLKLILINNHICYPIYGCKSRRILRKN